MEKVDGGEEEVLTVVPVNVGVLEKVRVHRHDPLEYAHALVSAGRHQEAEIRLNMNDYANAAAMIGFL